jgi:hypothetical protein
MSDRRYFLTRRPFSKTTRACWTSPSSGELYCGICLRATVAPRLGAECPSCGSTVERILEVKQGGLPGRLAPRRNRPAASIAAMERVGKVVTL